MKQTRLLILLLLLLQSIVEAFAQQSFQGRVVEGKSDKGIESVSVSVLNSENGIIAYTFTEADGNFVIQSKEKPHYISCTCLGYEPMILPVETFKPGETIRLSPKEYQLREVKILSNRIQEKNDTLIYQVSGYRMKQDRSIADVLKKMPGIEVLPSGQIKFEDKAINKLYIEGLDLMGGRYALATNNLSGKIVKEVQVLRNHQTIAALRGKSFVESAALNLVLTDDARSHLTGSIDMGLGYSANNDLLWDIRVLGMLLQKKQQNLSLYKSNNTGQDVSDEIKIQAIGEDTETGEVETLLRLPSVSVREIDEQRYLMNKSHLLATNQLFRVNKESTLRARFNYLSEQDRMEEKEVTSYFYPEGTINLTEENDIALQTSTYGLELDYQSNGDKQYIRNRLTGDLKKNDAQNALQTNNLPTQADNRIKRQQVSNYFQYINTYGSGHVIKLSSINQYSNLPQQLTVTPGLYEEILHDGKSYDGFVQEVNLQSFHSLTTTELQLKVAGFYTHMQAGVEYDYQQLRSSLECRDEASGTSTFNAVFHNDLRFTDVRLFASPSIQYNNYQWKFRLNIPFSYHLYNLNERSKGSKTNNFPHFFVEPSFYLKYNLNAYWSISEALNYRIQTPNINQLFTNYIFTDYRNAMSGSDFYYTRALANVISLSYNHPLSGFFWSLTGTITPMWEDKVRSVTQEGILNSVVMMDMAHKNQQWSIRSRLTKSFGWKKLFLGLTGNYSELKDKNLLSGQLVPFSVRNLLLALNFSIQPSKYLSIEGNEKYISSSLSSNITPRVSSDYFRSSLTINAFPTEKWKLKWNNLWLSGEQSAYSSIYFMDVAISFLHKKAEIELIVNNIFNNDRFQQIHYSSMSESKTLTYFRPREIMIKLLMNF